MKKLNKLFAILFAVLGATTLKAQNWTDITNGNGNTFTTKYADPTNDDVFETWTNTISTKHAFDWNQTVTNIPDGVYELSANAMYRASLTYGTPTNCVLYATVGEEEYTTPIPNFADFTALESRDKIATQMKNNDAYKSKIGNIIVENGEAKIGIKSIGELVFCNNGYWFVCKKSTFSFKNVTDSYFAGLQEKINRMLASAVESNAKTVLNTALATYNTATVENIKGLQAAITEFMQTASTANPIDVTSYMVNPSFEGGSITYWYQDLGYTQSNNRDIKQPTGWNLLYSSAKVGNTQYQSFMPKTDGSKDGNCLYVRHRWSNVKAVEDLRQSVQELPAGQYKLVVSVKGGGSVTDANTLTLSSGSNTATTIISDFDKTNYKDYSVTVNKTADNATLDICYGFKQTSGGDPEQLYYIDDFRLYYLGEDLGIYKDMYDAAHDKAIAARDNDEYINVIGLERTNLNDAINQTIAEATKESYLAAISTIEIATGAFIAAKSDYETLAGEITIAESLGMPEDLIASATATTKTGLVALQDLKVAEYSYITGTYTKESTIGAWTEDFKDDLNGEGYYPNSVKYFDHWEDKAVTRTAKQTLTLPTGDYALSIIARGQSGASGTLYYKIGDVTTSTNLIMKGNTGYGVDVNGKANFSADATYSNNGYGRGWEYRFITFHLDAETDVEIGATVNVNKQWASIYAPKLYFNPSSNKDLALADIANLLTVVPNGYMNAEIENTLNTTKIAAQNASEANTAEELKTIYEEFKNAIDAANASIAAYEKLANYIDMTTAFTDVTAYEQKYENRLFTTDEVESVRQELNVMRYNAASEIFPNKVEVTGWTGTMGDKNTSGQHWDGTADTKYYDNNSWNGTSHSTTTNITLPAGTYVLKAALRSHPSTSLSLTVLDKVVNVEGKDDMGYGIDTNGDANFSDEGTYANDDKGRGWEWEFVKFELTEDTNVTLKVECNYNGVYGWASFSDITLWMDDETYINVNGHAIDAPLAAAKALVNTKPMGTAENTALANAITLGEGTISTPADLNGAVDALNTAVANANAWVAAYNEAKAPLVAALERFEADFNLGNGLHGYMKNGLWANVLDQVQAAAVAKDVTDSYEGFADAANNLNTALDAAQASINMYANLAAEISYAEAYTPVVAENADGHTAAIEVAQAAYTAAEIDDASALIFDMQNYRALDYIHVTKRYTEIELGEWTGQTNSGDGEHWSNNQETTYFDYSKWSNGYINGANEATQTINLLAGEYVLMAAGRAANVAGTEAYIKVNDTKVNFPSKDAYGYGIATDGAANYAADGTYGRDNEGYGWEYRFITFTLTEEAEVTLVAGMTIDVNTADLSWASVCTPVLYKRTATEVDLVITDAEWATFMLPFDAELPDGVKAYSCDEVAGDALVLEEAESFVANTPYLVNGAEGTYNFSGYSIAEEDNYTVGLFTGTYVEIEEAPVGSYVLQKNDDVVAFYLVGEEIQPTVGAYHCYLTVPAEVAGAPMFSISRGEDTTGIENATLNTQHSTVIYDLMGRRVDTMVKGNMYIVNGKKVIVK